MVRHQRSIGVAFFVLAAIAAQSCRSPENEPSVEPPELLITGATLIDATGAPPRPETTILVRDGRIATVVADAEAEAPPEARRIDATGKFVIPDLDRLLSEAEGLNQPEAHDHSIRIVATDDGYQFPDRVSAGMTHVVFANQGSTIHEAMFIKLPDGMTGDDYLEAVRNGISFPEGAIDYAGPGLTSPGETVEIWLDLDPGDYLLGCWFRGHLTSLPPQVLRVNEAGSAGATPPREDAILRLIDFRFELEGELSQGARVLRVETPGPSMHEVDIFRLEDGQTLDDLRQWYKGGKKGTPPAVAIGGVMDSHDLSQVVWLRTDFRPGRHVLWCNMDIVPDVPGPTHADSGMFTEFVIE